MVVEFVVKSSDPDARRQFFQAFIDANTYNDKVGKGAYLVSLREVGDECIAVVRPSAVDDVRNKLGMIRNSAAGRASSRLFKEAGIDFFLRELPDAVPLEVVGSVKDVVVESVVSSGEKSDGVEGKQSVGNDVDDKVQS